MIVVRRCPTNVKKLKQNIRSITFSMSAQPSASTSCSGVSGVTTGTGAESGGQSQEFDWEFAFSPENKTKTIEMLTVDRENSVFSYANDDASFRKAAVLIPLCYDLQGRPSVLYNLRSANLNTHKGEISFPGGTMDPEDNDDPVAAALRETHEELGISRDAIEIWTTLRSFPTVSTNMEVVPVLGFVQSGPVDPTALNINPDEVDHAFTVSLKHLCDPGNWNDQARKFRGSEFVMPTWKNLNVFNGSEEIKLWGLTSFITHLLLSTLLPSNAYTRELPNFPLNRIKPPIHNNPSNKTKDDKPTSNL